MDTSLFIIALILFAALYIGLAVYLFWSLVICVILLMVYMSARYGNVVENYPFNLNETLSSILLIATTWAVFILVGPKPIPFLGSSIVYSNYAEATLTAVIDVVVVFIFLFLIILAILVPWLERTGSQGTGGGPGGGGGDQGGNVSVGS
jgi:uncharacterized membrane protein YgcG